MVEVLTCPENLTSEGANNTEDLETEAAGLFDEAAIIEATSKDPVVAQAIAQIEEESRDAYINSVPNSSKACPEENANYSLFVSSEVKDEKQPKE